MFLAALFVTVLLSNLSQFRIELELALEGLDLGGHGHDLLIVRGLGPPLFLADKPIIFGLGHFEQRFMVSEHKLAIEVVIVLATDVGLEVVAGYDLVCIKKDLWGHQQMRHETTVLFFTG